MPPEFWLGLVPRMPSETAYDRVMNSAVVEALLAEVEPRRFSPALFRRLTGPAFLPEVKGHGLALSLLRYEGLVLGGALALEPPSAPGASASESSPMSPLQRRCLDGLKASLLEERGAAARAELRGELVDALRASHPALAEIFLAETEPEAGGDAAELAADPPPPDEDATPIEELSNPPTADTDSSAGSGLDEASSSDSRSLLDDRSDGEESAA
jgi:hypothetical protein